tara:strand:- start:523 stop:1011 length:489 start_codon:yes stop_codon:yes gene_type:complete
MQVIDNFLEESEFKRLKDEVYSPAFLWEYNPNTASDDDPKDLFWNTKFTHLAFENLQRTTAVSIFNRYLQDPKLKLNCLKRLIINSYNWTPEVYEHPTHVDYNFKHKGAILNFTTCDGYTLVEGEKIPSVANRVIIHDPSKPHCGTTTTNAKRRVIANINYF